MSRAAGHYREVSATFTSLVAGTTDWEAPTPVPEWRAHDVVEHLVTWVSGAVRAWTGMEVADEPNASLPHRWRVHTTALQSLFDEPASADKVLTSGPFSGEALAPVLDRIYTPDVFMHSWDLARATGQPVVLDPGFAADLLAGMRAMGPVIRDSGQFGSEQRTSSTDPVDQLMAFIGRDPEWRGPA